MSMILDTVKGGADVLEGSQDCWVLMSRCDAVGMIITVSMQSWAVQGLQGHPMQVKPALSCTAVVNQLQSLGSMVFS